MEIGWQTGGDDAVIRLWPVDIAEIAESACLAAGTSITADEWKKYLGNKTYRDACKALNKDHQVRQDRGR